MKKAMVISLSVLILGSAMPAMAHEYFDRRGDRVDARWDARGDRINERLDRRGERINDRLDALAAKARAEGKIELANRLDRKGDLIEARLDRRGDRIDTRFDRRGDRINDRFDHNGHHRFRGHRH